MADRDDNYLKRELYALVRDDSAIFEFLQQGSLDGLWYWDLDKPESEWLSPRFWEILGYDPATKRHLSREWQDLIFPADLKTALENLKAHCADPGHPYDQLVRYRHASGSTVWVRCRGLAIRDREGRAVRMLGAHNEVTYLKNIEARLTRQTRDLREANVELERLATRDGLTNLFNRRAFAEHLEWNIAFARRQQETLSVMLVDLDHFKRINDTHGHAAGDAALAGTASALQAALRASDLPARYGGEEFAVVLPQTDMAASLMVAEKVRRRISRVRRRGVRRITASVGIATIPARSRIRQPRSLASTLLTHADRALYAAKKRGRNRACHYDDLPASARRPQHQA